jgi:hypothetical protein
MFASAQRVARLFKANAFRRQLEELTVQLAKIVRSKIEPGIDADTLAKRVVSDLLRQDRAGDGSFLGAVYSDLFDRNAFLRMLTDKLKPHRSAAPIAEEILLKLEDQK